MASAMLRLISSYREPGAFQTLRAFSLWGCTPSVMGFPWRDVTPGIWARGVGGSVGRSVENARALAGSLETGASSVQAGSGPLPGPDCETNEHGPAAGAPRRARPAAARRRGA